MSDLWVSIACTILVVGGWTLFWAIALHLAWVIFGPLIIQMQFEFEERFNERRSTR
jgi:protein-S-isoprenylcysteine O-methyltransferase Ste14